MTGPLRIVYEEIQCAKHYGIADKWFSLDRDTAAVLFAAWISEGRLSAVKAAKDQADREIASAVAKANASKK